ncbi:MAG TPA: hypothetical protein VIP70_07650, partial [Nitrososphaeraceae archaeon]
ATIAARDTAKEISDTAKDMKERGVVKDTASVIEETTSVARDTVQVLKDTVASQKAQKLNLPPAPTYHPSDSAEQIASNDIPLQQPKKKTARKAIKKR